MPQSEEVELVLGAGWMETTVYGVLPFPTALDDSDLLTGSADPLGTLAGAERIADLILPNMTARMWRPRYLTLSAVAAHVAQRVTEQTGQDEMQLSARMAFERLFVSAMVRREGEDWEDALSKLPGQRLARGAWREKQPLTTRNFLQGAAVNGPFGVMMRLARATGVLNKEDDYLARAGENLLEAWACDRGLEGFLHAENHPGSPGAKILRRWQDAAMSVAGPRGHAGTWPGSKSEIWDELREHLRPDDLKPTETTQLRKLLTTDPVRRRVLILIRGERVRLQSLRREFHSDRGRIERRFLDHFLLPKLGKDGLDGQIATAITLAVAFEDSVAVLQSSFDALLWSLGCLSGAAARAKVIARPGDGFWERIVRRAGKALRSLDNAAATLENHVEFDKPELRQPVQEIRDVLAAVAESRDRAVEAVKERHLAVQRDKSKPPWIDFGGQWILGRGIAVDDEVPPRYEAMMLHPYRIENADRFLADLKGLGGLHA